MTKGLWKEIRDQGLHVLVGVIGVVPLAVWPGVFSMAWAFLVMGAIREITEEGNPVTLNRAFNGIVGSTWDLGWWLIGGVAVGMAVYHA